MLLLSQNLHNFFSHLDVITDQPQETGKKYSAELGVTVTHYENMVGAAGDADEGMMPPGPGCPGPAMDAMGHKEAMRLDWDFR